MPACDIPEHDLGQRVAVCCVVAPHRVKQRLLIAALDSRIKFHIGNDVQLCGQLRLREMRVDRRPQDQIKDRLQIGVGHIVVGCAEVYLLRNIPSLDLYELRSCRKRDEVPGEGALCVLREVDAQRQRRVDRTGRCAVHVHGAGAVHDRQRVFRIVAEHRQRVPCRIQRPALLCRQHGQILEAGPAVCV